MYPPASLLAVSIVVSTLRDGGQGQIGIAGTLLCPFNPLNHSILKNSLPSRYTVGLSLVPRLSLFRLLTYLQTLKIEEIAWPGYEAGMILRYTGLR